MKRVLLPLILFAATGAALAENDPSPYTGFEGRDIKSLSPAEVRGYLEGHGMGFAMPAELNSYPGPKHVLELAAELALDDDQRAATEAAFARMHAEAVELGQRYVTLEAALDELFAAGRADSAAVRRTVLEIGEVRARLRLAHLEAHVAMVAILTPEQVARYDELRGYAGAKPGR